jgi:hypothetical protein
LTLAGRSGALVDAVAAQQDEGAAMATGDGRARLCLGKDVRCGARREEQAKGVAGWLLGLTFGYLLRAWLGTRSRGITASARGFHGVLEAVEEKKARFFFLFRM